MSELAMIMREMLEELKSINEKLDEIRGDGLYNSIADIYDKLNDLQGNGAYNTLANICEKLGDVEGSVSSLESTMITM